MLGKRFGRCWGGAEGDTGSQATTHLHTFHIDIRLNLRLHLPTSTPFAVHETYWTTIKARLVINESLWSILPIQTGTFWGLEHWWYQLSYSKEYHFVISKMLQIKASNETRSWSHCTERLERNMSSVNQHMFFFPLKTKALVQKKAWPSRRHAAALHELCSEKC